MSGTEDLKNLLAKLKDEAGPILPDPPHEPRRVEREASRREPPARPERFTGSQRSEPPRDLPAVHSGANQVWSENKETMLFGMLASLTAALGGILAGIDYLVLIGAGLFSLFSLAMLFALFRFTMISKARNSEGPGLTDRVDTLSKKIEMLSSRAATGAGSPYSSGNQDKERELDQKVEELRVLVKTLSKAVNGEK